MDQANFKFYQADNVYGALFFQFPKVLMYSQQYRGLSDAAKLAYMVLKDRLEYSLRNHWIDEEGHVYFIFTNQELKDLFDCSNDKLAAVKKDLERAGLLYQKAMHFNPKTGKNEPNRLYLAELDMQSTDVYLRGEYAQKEPQTLATSENPKIGRSRETAQTLATSENPKIGHSRKFVDDTPQTLATSENPKIGHDLYKDFKNIDTNRYNIDTQKLDFSTAHFSPAEIQKQNQDLVNHADEFLTDSESGWEVFLEPEAIQLLSFWCRTPQQMRRFIRIILNAKNNLEKEHQALGVKINLGDDTLKPLITKTLRRYFNVLRSNEKHVKDVENYLYGTMTNLFGIYWNKLAGAKYRAQHLEEFKNQGVISD
ncbi:replication initiator protein A [Lentilactobacillus buchneri]|uniref:replication initiator protein A n=1 Tax=Lentilactobacillus buchneri TaxID=1581 RepID=UPI001290D394|nr:replication initiator protein A [Lentilactobacillus buchneri]MQM78784.1 replication initiator protein A [Lentilactobacillus buchneri]MQM86577.1 replication initiator protein A [Lentilactobacillus buchneri]MQN20989.1 replication initiator protein A [Lentilactobacillus buchneri]